MTPSFQLTTLGSLSLSVGGVPALAGRRKLLVLLAYMARHPGRKFERPFLADLGWPDTPESRGRASLRQALSELRDTLGPALVIDGDLAGVAPGLVDVDADRFRVLVDAGDHESALHVWQGEFIPGVDGIVNGELRSWLDLERESLRHKFAFAARAAVDARASRGAFLDAAVEARRWSETLPFDDVAAVRWVTMLRLGGRSAEAEVVATALASRWRRELGAEPPPDLVQRTAHSTKPADGAPVLPMVARAAEFSVLSALWQQTSAGRCGVVVIEGEAGTGRSRLLSDFSHWVHESDTAALVLSTRAFEAERGDAWSTLRHLMPALASAPGIAGVAPSALAAIAQEVPEFAERYPAHAATLPSLTDAVARALADVAAERPILVAVDDAHLADGPSRTLLEHLSRHPADGTMLVITADSDAFPVADAAHQQGAIGVLHRIRLRPFNAMAMRQLIAGMGEFDVADATVLVDWLVTESGGSPLVATALLAGLVDEGLLRGDGAGVWRLMRPLVTERMPVPPALAERLGNQVKRLDADARATVEVAAVLGREFDLDSLRALTAWPDERLDDALASLTRSRMIEALPGGDRLRFTLDLLRRVTYDGLGPLRRASLQARVRRLRGRGQAFGSPRVRLAAAVVLLVGASAVLGARHARAARPGSVRIVPGTEVAGASSPELARAADAALHATLDGVPGLTLVSDGRLPSDQVLSVSVSMQGPDLTVSGALRSPAGDTIATEVVTGGRENLAPLVATAAERLLRNDHVLPAPGFRITAAHTAVPAALLKYFEAEELARKFRMDEAAQGYFEAVQLDRGFAAAWHGLARVNGWFGLGDRMQRAEDSASAHASSLSPRDRQVLAGWAAFASGRANSAEQSFRGVLGFAPDLVEAQVGLGEVLYHHNWMRGRDGLDSRAPWSAALRLDSLDWRAVAHASEVAARVGNAEEAVRWLRQVQRTRGDTLPPVDEALLAAALLDDSIAIERAFAGLDGASDWALTTITIDLARLAQRPDLAERTAERLVTPSHAREVRAFGWEVLSDLALARGHLGAATAYLDSASALEPWSASIARGVLLATPFVPASARGDSVKRVVASGLVQGTAPDVVHLFLFWFDYDRSRDGAERPYLAELLRYQVNALNGRFGTPAKFPRVALGDSNAMTSVLLTPSLAGWAALAAGDTVAALVAFRRGWEGVEFSEASFSAFMTRPWDVYKTGELLEASGDLAGAAAWYGNAGWVGLHDIAYTAPGQIRRGLVLERLGRRDEARTAYRRALRFWQSPDAEFRSLADSAARRLAALTP